MRPSSISQRVASARLSRIVGRESILSEFRDAISQEEFPFCVLQIHGPGGIGKTTLLEALMQRCRTAGIPVVSIDARMIEPTPTGFLGRIANALDTDSSILDLSEVTQRLAQLDRFALFIDTYESVGPLDGWFRDEFLPNLSASSLIVTAGRQLPPEAWRRDPGWQALVRTIALRNFSPAETYDFLTRRGIPADQHDQVARFTHGYPLALSLVSDLYTQEGAIDLSGKYISDVVPVLLERFLDKSTTLQQRAALHVCALVRWTTEPLLSSILGEADAGDSFEWLRQLSFVEAGQGGLAPHETAREALMAELKWRDPDRDIELHRRASDYYAQRVRATSGEDQERTLFDFVYLHRDNSVVAEAFTWPENISVYGDPISAADIEGLAEMVEGHEGAESAGIFRQWAVSPAVWGQVYRRSGGKDREPLGFAMSIALGKITAAEAEFDPGTAAVLHQMQSFPALRQGEAATFSRFWMDAENYQGVSVVQSVIVLTGVRYYLTTPGLAYTFFATTEPEFWEAAYRYAEMHRFPEADFEVGGRVYGVFGHDWRQMGPVQWLQVLAEREIAGDNALAPRPQSNASILVLSKQEFGLAVRRALKCYPPAEDMGDNLLLRSRLVVEKASSDSDSDRAQKLRDLVRTAVDGLQSSPRRKISYDCVFNTYIDRKGSQEDVADLLDLPFSTYRRHLTAGINLVAEALWALEIGG